MKKILYAIVMAVALMPAVMSCSKNDDDAPRSYPTETEIQGRWGFSNSYVTYIVDFHKPEYGIYLQSGKDLEMERGTYKMQAGGEIVLTPSNGDKSRWSPLEAYWEGEGKSTLHLYPIGAFIRVK